ncbi:hypothetical protein [Crucivirus-474]|nr:hypothetical protein [Crucivirus-474]
MLFNKCFLGYSLAESRSHAKNNHNRMSKRRKLNPIHGQSIIDFAKRPNTNVGLQAPSSSSSTEWMERIRNNKLLYSTLEPWRQEWFDEETNRLKRIQEDKEERDRQYEEERERRKAIRENEIAEIIRKRNELPIPEPGDNGLVDQTLEQDTEAVWDWPDPSEEEMNTIENDEDQAIYNQATIDMNRFYAMQRRDQLQRNYALRMKREARIHEYRQRWRTEIESVPNTRRMYRKRQINGYGKATPWTYHSNM